MTHVENHVNESPFHLLRIDNYIRKSLGVHFSPEPFRCTAIFNGYPKPIGFFLDFFVDPNFGAAVALGPYGVLQACPLLSGSVAIPENVVQKREAVVAVSTNSLLIFIV